jgi:5'-3' exonuclease
MGIKGLRDLIKRQVKEKESYFEQCIPVLEFQNKRVVVDASLYLYTYKATHQEDFIIPFEHLINLFQEAEITLLFVFDGISPEEKSKEKQKRCDQRQLQKTNLELLEKDLQNFKITGVVSDDLQKTHDKYLQTNSKAFKNLTSFSYYIAQSSLTKKANNIVEIKKQDVLDLKQLLDRRNVSHIIADGEAEVVASSIVKQGLADAVLTRDSDALACGAPVIINQINLYTRELTIIKFQTILDVFDLSFDSWLDLCIMCGTDFNKNIPKIGPVNSLKLIKQHKTLENISKQINTDILDYVNVRSLFLLNFDRNLYKDNNFFFVQEDIESAKPEEGNILSEPEELNILSEPEEGNILSEPEENIDL